MNYFDNKNIKLDVLKKKAHNLRWAEVEEGSYTAYWQQIWIIHALRLSSRRCLPMWRMVISLIRPNGLACV